jgi:hypothetical protein
MPYMPRAYDCSRASFPLLVADVSIQTGQDVRVGQRPCRQRSCNERKIY